MVRRSTQTPDTSGNESRRKVTIELVKKPRAKTDLAQMYIDSYGRQHWLPYSEIIERPHQEGKSENTRVVEIPYWLAVRCGLQHDVEEI